MGASNQSLVRSTVKLYLIFFWLTIFGASVGVALLLAALFMREATVWHCLAVYCVLLMVAVLQRLGARIHQAESSRRWEENLKQSSKGD